MRLLPRIRILLVEDERSLAETLRIALEREGYEVRIAYELYQALNALDEETFHLVVTDMKLPDGEGREILTKVKVVDPGCPVIIMTAYATVGDAVEMMKEGAYHYLTKPFHLEEFKILVRRACEHRQLGEENLRLKARAKSLELPRMIAKSPAMRSVQSLIERAAQVDTTVLILGESGTGKEVIARTIHELSPFRSGPFVPVNCGALPENLVEAELFGYEKGAFTGADSARPGLVEEAEGGTLFLDEIAELPLPAQVKLLRVLQERKVRRLGARREREVHLRFISATNKNLASLVQEGRFREDLYFRLNVLTISVPPLRERQEDLPELVDDILRRLSRKLRLPLPPIAPDVMQALGRYPFPGNVRELENLLERAMILSGGETLMLKHFPEEIRKGTILPATSPIFETFPQGFQIESYLEGVERTLIEKALELSGGVKTRAAEILGITFRQFRYKAKKYGIV